MVKKRLRGVICAVVTSMLLSSAIPTFASEAIQGSGNYSIVVEGFDWGPGVTKAIVEFDGNVSNVSKDTFKVEEVKGWFTGIQGFERQVVNAYVSSEEGNAVVGESRYVTIELAVNPEEGSPFLYNIESGRNNWSEPYSLNIELVDGETVTIDDEDVTKLNINSEYVNRYTPSIDEFKEETYSAEGDISMKYAYYEPDEDNGKNPLIIWLHGAGEGGEDTTINTLGNKVSALIDEDIQNQFGGAYVLAPQTPTMWMDMGDINYTDDGTTIYLESLMNLIYSYVESNKDIDENRIYIGGCSNGGFMTMALILENPEYFAAAYPICEAFKDEWISDEKLEKIKNLPIWFTYAENDEVVNPTANSIATIERLKANDAKNIRVSVFNNVIDTSGLYKDKEGNAYEYNGHWSWIYAFNDECKDGEESLWSWLANQKKDVVEDGTGTETPEDPDDNINENPDNNTNDSDADKDKIEGSTEEDKSNSNTKDEEISNTSNKLDKLPNTGDPITPSIFVLFGAISTIIGSNVVKKK